MSIENGLIYPPGWKKEQNEAEDLIEELIIKAGRHFADVAVKWGERYAQDENTAVFRTKNWGIKPNITITASSKPEKQGVILRKKDHSGLFAVNPYDKSSITVQLPPGQLIERTTSGLQKVVTKEPGGIVWDLNLNLEESSEILEKIDKEAEKRGLYDTNKKLRLPLPEQVYIPMPNIKVDEVFIDIGVAFPIFDKSPEKALNMFDHPEDLVIRKDPYSGEPTVIAHERDVEYLDKREQIINEILIEKGLTLHELKQGLMFNPSIFQSSLVGIKTEVDQRTKFLLKAEKLKRLPRREDSPSEATRDALIAFYESRSDEGKRIFKKAMKQYPNTSYIPHEYAVALIHMESDYESAYPLLVKSTELEPKKALHFYQTAECARRLERYSEAIEWLEKAKKQKDYMEFVKDSGEKIDLLINAIKFMSSD